MGALGDLGLIFEQTYVLAAKHFAQKRRGGRATLKELIVTPLFLFAATGALMLIASTTTFPSSVYLLHGLPPLSDNGYDWGVFSPSSPANNDDEYGYISSTTLYYAPNNHDGVNSVMMALQDMYPDVNVVGEASSDDILDEYQNNLFKTYGSIEFALTPDQVASGNLVTQGVAGDDVTYSIRISPVNMILPTDTTTTVYNDLNTPADTWSNSGYLTIQNFINTYLANIQKNGVYTGTSTDFSVDTLLQRYPESDVYDDTFAFSMSEIRWFLWKWMAPAVITIALFTPMLSLTTQLVREKQFKMKDILEISGLFSISFWLSFLVAIAVLTQASIWIGCLLLTAMGPITTEMFFGYIALMTTFVLAMAPFSFALSHILDQAEYYGLPTFIMNTALAVGGVWVANDHSISMGGKLVLGFLLPPLQLCIGIFALENFSYNNEDVTLDFNYVDADKVLPSVTMVCMMFLLSSLFYMFISWGYPFDWLVLTANEDMASLTASVRADIIPYHCDNQQVEEEAAAKANGKSITVDPNLGKVLLDVEDIAQIYPDGTQAVKSMTFQVRDGEVLSYLGANGAGKSTTMGMLCGTLVPTFGDATVNGHSITRDRTEARRNLGICMQQDIIWDDVSIEDHLMLFGQLRGTRGAKLRADVDKMLESLGFPEKAKSLAGTLSGGQKRRLCVGLAMVGGNSVVFLDEPTAGLDPVSRRQLWELIQANRNGRAILLTTHFMDEADVLGDRIAIVKEGRLRALGTSKYLKSRFGMGYLLRCSLKAGVPAAPIMQIIHKYIPTANIVSNAGTELAIRMPKEAVSMFADMMESLEHSSNSVGVLSFGIETTTLEEVFMRIVNEDTEMMMRDPEEAAKMLGASGEERSSYIAQMKEMDDKRNPLSDEQVHLILTKGRVEEEAVANPHKQVEHEKSGFEVFTTQLGVLLWKRRHQFDRSRGQWAFSLTVPVALLALAAVIMQLIPDGIIGNEPSATDIGAYTPFMTTPVSAATSTDAAAYASAANLTDVVYSGPSYESLFNYVNEQSTLLVPGNNSLAGVYFEANNNFTVMYNATTPLELPALVNQLLQTAVNEYTSDELHINTVCRPLPESALGNQTNYGILFCFVIAIWVGSMGGGMSIVLSGERVGLVKHQQLASGCSKFTYWIANFIFDASVMMLQVFILMLCMYSADASHFENNDAGDLLLTGIVFVAAQVFRFYVVSFIVDDIKMVQSIFFYGSLCSIFIFIIIWVQIVYTANHGNLDAGSSQFATFLLSLLDPTFGFAFFLLFKHNFLGATTLVPGIEMTLILPMFVSGVVSFLALVGVEFGTEVSAFASFLWFKIFGGVVDTDESNTRTSFVGIKKDTMCVEEGEGSGGRKSLTVRQARRVDGEDPDVVEERHHVEAVHCSKMLNKKDHSIFIHNLSKVYHGRGTVPTKVAVNGVSLSVARGEVFGLLGANGAGKTTLLKMVSGLELPTTGDAYINGYDVVSHRNYAQRSMGLCPQFDTLIERLSVRENLLYFGIIKGINELDLEPVVKAYMTALNIKKYENKLIQHLSGGNRRKVSLAVALMGCPPTVYLDEPSTGLDPVASRLMWRLLSKISATKSNALVLTTHNMLECEAVCTRIGVMKTGQLVCLGDSQHLRSVHGTGFLLEVVVKNPKSIANTKSFIEQHFSGAVIVDEHSTMINYEIPSAAIPKLSVAFRTIENNKADLDIIDYALSQSTLEQVFLKQIRPNTEVSAADGGSASLTGSELRHGGKNGPSFLDYFNGYSIWLLAGIIPGLHQFYLGDTWRGVKYFFTLNEVFVGWLLDLFEMHVLIQKRVEQYGSSHVPFCCSCCYSVKAARTAPSTNGSLRGSTNSTSAGMQNPLAGSSDRQ